MNFNCSEIQKDLRDISGKIPKDVDINEILDAIKTPSLSNFSESARMLLPKNLYQIDKNTGELKLQSAGFLEESITSAVDNIQDILSDNIEQTLKGIRGDLDLEEKSSTYYDLEQFSEILEENSAIPLNNALEVLNNAKTLNEDASNLSSIYNASDETIEDFTKMSPKNIRDLGINDEYYNKVKDSILESAVIKTKLESELVSQEGLINHQLDNSAYENLFATSFSNNFSTEDFELTMTVQREVYWADGEGSSIDSSSKTTFTGFKLLNDYSLAVDNTSILIGCKISFSDETLTKEREAVDILNQSKGISLNGNFPVVAIYFDTKKEALIYLEKYPKKIVSAKIKYPVAKRNENSNKKKERLNEIKKKIEEENDRISRLKKELGIQ